MQYDTNFKSRLSTLYTECQHPLLEAAMPDAGSFLEGIARMLASKRMITLSPFWLTLSLLRTLLTMPPMLSCFPKCKKWRYIVV